MNSQCGNLRIFLFAEFYVKSTIVNLDQGTPHNENLTKGQWKKPQKLLVCIEKCLF